MQPILVAEETPDLKIELHTLSEPDLNFTFVSNGKDAQLNIYKNEYSTIIINMDIKENTGIEVLRYIKFNASLTKVILVFNNKETLNDYKDLRKEFKKMGVADLLVKPFSVDKLVTSIRGEIQYSLWKSEFDNSQQSTEEENLEDDIPINISDNEFTKIKINYFLSGNTCVFDCYLRLTKNKYIKILYKNNYLAKDRLKHYEKNTNFLYFRTKDRLLFISYFNNILDQVVNKSKIKVEQKIELSRDLIEKYVEETYAKGMQNTLMEEGIKLTKNMFSIINQTPSLNNFLREYTISSANSYSHLFLVTFYAMSICKKMEWTTDSTIQKVAFGGILHDIGKLKLPSNIRDSPYAEMTTAQQEVYKEHPKIGAEMLSNVRGLHESVRQIVYQHHECEDSEGFPNGISGIRIFPLAKVINIADHFSNLIINKNLTPINALKQFIPDRSQTKMFDSNLIKALIKCFIKDNNKNKKIFKNK